MVSTLAHRLITDDKFFNYVCLCLDIRADNAIALEKGKQQIEQLKLEMEDSIYAL